MKVQFFKTQTDLRRWLKKNGGTAKELWIGFYKKSSGKMGVTYAQALDEALCFGWIDGIKKSVGEMSYTNRFTPRRPKSVWSKINTGHVERLTKAGMMTPAGLEAVELAKREGSWERAYASPRNAALPADFLKELKKNRRAKAFFDTLDKRSLYSITFRIQNAKKPETRDRWIKKIVAMLAKGEEF
jgi:uncharacterized protein YdeI (YjbR/CyaY-like superfamily)